MQAHQIGHHRAQGGGGAVPDTPGSRRASLTRGSLRRKGRHLHFDNVDDFGPELVFAQRGPLDERHQHITQICVDLLQPIPAKSLFSSGP